MMTTLEGPVSSPRPGGEIAATTGRILAVRHEQAERLAAHCAAYVLPRIRGPRLVRLRDLTTALWAEFYYELVLGERCPPAVRALVVRNAQRSGLGAHNRRLEERLTRFLIERLEAGDVPHELPARLAVRQRALYLQSTFLTTAVADASDVMTRVLLLLAQQPAGQTRACHDDDFLDGIITTTMSGHPGFARGAGHLDGPTGFIVAAIAIRVAVRETFRRLTLHASASRPLTHGAPCLLLPRALEHRGYRSRQAPNRSARDYLRKGLDVMG